LKKYVKCIKNVSEYIVCGIGKLFKEQLHIAPLFLLFRLHKERVFYVSEKIMKQAANVARENLISLGMDQRESRRGTGSVVDPVGSASFCRSGIGIVLPDPDWERTRICIYFNEK